MDTEHYYTGVCKHGILYEEGCSACEDAYEQRTQGMKSVLYFIHCRCTRTGQYGMWVTDNNERFFTKHQAQIEQKEAQAFQQGINTTIIPLKNF